MWLSEIKNIPYTKLVLASIQFMVVSNNRYPIPYAYCCKVDDLINDWWGDCNFVPENDATLLSATLYVNGNAYPIERVGLNEDITFETLMEALDYNH